MVVTAWEIGATLWETSLSRMRQGTCVLSWRILLLTCGHVLTIKCSCLKKGFMRGFKKILNATLWYITFHVVGTFI